MASEIEKSGVDHSNKENEPDLPSQEKQALTTTSSAGWLTTRKPKCKQ